MEQEHPHPGADATQTERHDGPDRPTQPLATSHEDELLPHGDESLPYEDLAEEALPMRPRRRLLTPWTAGLVALLVGALGFWGGVEVQKDHGSSAGGVTAAGFTARKATSGKTALAGGFAPPGASSGGGETSGEVAYIKGSTLYVTDAEDNTVKVATTSATNVSHTVTTHSIKAIHPGDTITVQGTKSKSGAVTATSVTLGSTSASTSARSATAAATGATLFGEGASDERP